jgi:hypothetical protein
VGSFNVNRKNLLEFLSRNGEKNSKETALWFPANFRRLAVYLNWTWCLLKKSNLHSAAQTDKSSDNLVKNLCKRQFPDWYNHHLYLHTYICTCILTYVCTCILTYVCTCILTYVPAYLHTYVPLYLHMYLHTYICTCILTYVPAYLHMYLHTYICTWILTYVPAYLHMYLHTYIWEKVKLHIPVCYSIFRYDFSSFGCLELRKLTVHSELDWSWLGPSIET